MLFPLLNPTTLDDCVPCKRLFWICFENLRLFSLICIELSRWLWVCCFPQLIPQLWMIMSPWNLNMYLNHLCAQGSLCDLKPTLSILRSKRGNNIWFIDHATLNNEVRRKVLYRFLLKWRKINTQNCRNTPCDLHSTSWSGFLFPCCGIEILVNFLQKTLNFQLEKHFSPKKSLLFVQKSQPKHWSGCKSQLSRYPDLHARGPYQLPLVLN